MNRVLSAIFIQWRIKNSWYIKKKSSAENTINFKKFMKLSMLNFKRTFNFLIFLFFYLFWENRTANLVHGKPQIFWLNGLFIVRLLDMFFNKKKIIWISKIKVILLISPQKQNINIRHSLSCFLAITDTRSLLLVNLNKSYPLIHSVPKPKINRIRYDVVRFTNTRWWNINVKASTGVSKCYTLAYLRHVVFNSI